MSERQGSSLLRAQIFGLREQVRRGDRHFFGEGPRARQPDNAERRTLAVFSTVAVFARAATQSRIQYDLVANREVLDALAKLRHNSSGIRAQHVREGRRESATAFSHPDIEVIESGRSDLHDRLATSRMRVGNLLDVHTVESAMFSNNDRFHFLSSS